MYEESYIEVYPVGLLSDIKRGKVRYGVKHYLIPQIQRRNWRAVRNYFNGYLAEWHFPPNESRHTRCGRGWTKRAALRRYGVIIAKANEGRR
jgi:hypothetical protein